MRVLLDTHTFLWFGDDSPQLSATARSLLVDPENIRMLSIASLWELAIKVSQDRMTFNLPFSRWVVEGLTRTEIALLGISVQHLNAVSTLPFHHRDPFDRMLIAQPVVEGIPIVSADEAFDAYPVSRLW